MLRIFSEPSTRIGRKLFLRIMNHQPPDAFSGTFGQWLSSDPPKFFVKGFFGYEALCPSYASITHG
jgi:hypothetical protein